jgi:hypothetical protein
LAKRGEGRFSEQYVYSIMDSLVFNGKTKTLPPQADRFDFLLIRSELPFMIEIIGRRINGSDLKGT